MRHDHRDQRGSALVIVVGLLALLAVIGFGFAVMARLHHTISVHYRASAQNDLIAHAAILYALSDIRYGWPNLPAGAAADDAAFQTGAVAEAVDSPADPWFVDPAIAAHGYEGADNRKHYCNARCSSYALVHDVLGERIGVSIVEVLDSAAKLNINDNYDDNRLRGILITLLGELQLPTDLAKGIVDQRNALPGKRFISLEQLKATNGDGTYKISGMDERSYEILKRYLTVYSWPHRLPAANGFPYYLHPNGADSLERVDSTAAPPDHVRSPININTAGKELLVALLNGIRRATGGTPIDLATARDIATWIVRKRDPENPEHWSEGIDWKAWGGTGYTRSRKHLFSCWSGYPLGAFDTWNEVVDFLYAIAQPPSGQTPPATPFRPLPDFTTEKAETVIAAICPSSFASLLGQNTWNLAFARIRQDGVPELVLRDEGNADTITPDALGKNQLAADGDAHPLCFSSMGRFEIASRTYAFVKAEEGLCYGMDGSETHANKLMDSTNTWSASPPRWRGYSVLIYAGKGEGQLRGIVCVDDPDHDGLGNTLIVDRWSVVPDAGSHYLIVGPGAFVDRVGENADAITIPAGSPHIIQDADPEHKFSWENDEWNGHRVVIYRATVRAGAGPNGEDVEDVAADSVQERIILRTKATGSAPNRTYQLQVMPELDATSLNSGSGHLSYLLLGCDGLVEHQAAVKAYDVIHHTTQEDFETYKAGATRVASGPNACEVDGALPKDRCRRDGWLAVAKKAVPAVDGAFRHNFARRDLAPDQGGTLVIPTLPLEQMVRDVFDRGLLTSEGLHLRSGTTAYPLWSHTGSKSVIRPERDQGGVVSFWFRPDVGFFDTDVPFDRDTILVVRGADDHIRVRYVGSERKLKVTVGIAHVRRYEGVTSTVVNYEPGLRTYEDPEYSDLSASGHEWRPGEWHHLAFAWYECDDTEGGDSTPGYDDDSNPSTPWQDDEPAEGGGDQPGNGLLDFQVGAGARQVFGVLRLWVDGKSSGILEGGKVKDGNKVKPFNFYYALDGTCIQMGNGRGIGGTVDGVLALGHTDKTLDSAEVKAIAAPGNLVRYDPGSGDYGTYTSAAIALPSADAYTLGTVAWTGLLPWFGAAEQWGQPGGPSVHPVRTEVSLGSETSIVVPRSGAPFQCYLGAGVPLRNSANDTISGNGDLAYKVHLFPSHGEEASNEMGKLKGRQTPVLQDITITVLGPIVFYHWR